MYELRNYQRAGVDSCLKYLEGSSNKGVCASFATAAGKSLVIAQTAMEYGEPAICLQPSKELLEQNLQKAQDLGIKNLGVYSASLGLRELSSGLTYATLRSVKKEAETLRKMGVSTLYIDECHFKFSEKTGGEFKEFLKILKPKKLIGYTATPFKLQPTMLGPKLSILTKIRGKFIHDIIHVTQNHEMVEGGWWTPINYEIHDFDESGLILNSSGSEFTEESVREVLHAEGVNNNVYLRLKKLRKDGYKSALVFVDSVESAEVFAKHVPDSVFVHAKTSKKERTRIVQDFKSGKLFCVFNVGILTTGFDFPELECVIMARPTNSLTLYSQIVGRGVRIHQNKDCFLYIDFCGNFGRFGAVENHELLNFPNYGWGLFSGERLLTGVPTSVGIVTKSELMSPPKLMDADFEFGKHVGKSVRQVFAEKDFSYLRYILENVDFDTPYKLKLRSAIESHLRLLI